MRAVRAHNKYCLPVIKQRRSEVIQTLKENLTQYRYAEIWLDYIEDLDRGFAASLVGEYPHRLVFVFRRKRLAPVQLTEARRFEILKTLSRKPALVDFDITSQADEIPELAKLSLKTVLSYHNYNQTPSDTELRSIVDRMTGWGAHITKISTFCTIQRDALRLLSLLIELREAGRRCVVLGMGKHGVITRIFGTQWGNEMIFTTIKSEQESAPGQLAIAKLDSIMQALR